MSGTITELAPAKLNLALHVRRRLPNGYHELETLFAFCADGDVVRAKAAEGLSLKVEGPFAADLSGEGDNLMLRAARRLAKVADIAPNAALRLEKNLPVASGIGGGSADAAATLRAFNCLWGLGYSLEQLAEIGLELGADVPACVHGKAMRGEGVGEQLAPVELGGWDGAPALLVNPGVAVSTASIFAAWDGEDRGALPGDIDTAIRMGRNDLAPPAMALAPAIGDLLETLGAQEGTSLVRMSGSGATCFALFDDAAARDSAQASILDKYPGWWTMATQLS